MSRKDYIILTKKLKNPCSKCVCTPICRHKSFNQLLNDCILVNNYIMRHDSYTYPRRVMTVLNPTRWEVGDNYLIKELDL
jgi:hypothetical protein